MATFGPLTVGQRYAGMADFTKADGTTGVIYTDAAPVRFEMTDPTILSIDIQPPPAGNAYPNNPVHVIATILKAGVTGVSAIAPDADPAEGPQSLTLTADIIATDPAAPPSVGGTLSFDPTPLP